MQIHFFKVRNGYPQNKVVIGRLDKAGRPHVGIALFGYAVSIFL